MTKQLIQALVLTFQPLHRLFGGELFGIFFPWRSAFTERYAVAGDFDDEGLFVLRALFGNHGIDWLRELVRLAELDQAAFVVELRFDDPEP